MGLLLEFVLELFADIFISNSSERFANRNDEIKKMLLDKSFFRSLDLNLDDRRRFEELVHAKSNNKTAQQ